MHYAPELYAAVNSTMYRYFALVGGPLTVLTLVSGAALVVLLRKQPGFQWTLAGVLGYAVAFAVWLAVVEPVNRRVAAAYASDPGSLSRLWVTARARWEYGHAAGFVLQLLGLASLVWSILTSREVHVPLGSCTIRAVGPRDVGRAYSTSSMRRQPNASATPWAIRPKLASVAEPIRPIAVGVPTSPS